VDWQIMLLINAICQFWAVILVSLICPSESWLASTISTRISPRTTSLLNVPPPAETDVEAFQAYASKQINPPSSFFELQKDVIRSIRLARAANVSLQEVEYPPLPLAVLEMDDVSTYQVSAANVQLAVETAQGLLIADDTVQQVAILLPDEAEKQFAQKVLGTTSANPFPGITIGSLRAANEGDDRLWKPEQFLIGLMGRGSGGTVKTIPGVQVYIVLTASAQELPDVQELHQLLLQEQADAEPLPTIVCYNLKLDVLRGDLGAPAFPPRSLQDDFLSQVKPVYYLRTRQYSRSTNRPPFLVNFQGCLFRCYPGNYQTLLDTGTNGYRRLGTSPTRPALGAFKQQLIEALQQQGVLAPAEETSSVMGFLRTGYKTTTWWEEDDRPAASNAWKT
jgi:Domain of unknown function (DUF1995)